MGVAESLWEGTQQENRGLNTETPPTVKDQITGARLTRKQQPQPRTQAKPRECEVTGRPRIPG